MRLWGGYGEGWGLEIGRLLRAYEMARRDKSTCMTRVKLANEDQHKARVKLRSGVKARKRI